MAKKSKAGKPEPSFSLKDELFNRERVAFLASRLATSVEGFSRENFIRECVSPFPQLELKQRIHHIAETLERYLDPNFPIASRQIVASLPEPLDPNLTDDDFGDFIFAPLGQYVVRNGSTKTHLRTSLKTLRELTMRFSMEDAIRSFINQFPDQTFTKLETWAGDSNYHVRRLVSEGTRPKLPWSGRLNTDPMRPLPLLDRLHADSTRYVTRSVANHLNDFAKENAKLVIDRLAQWKTSGQQCDKELAWMTRHALRTLIKQGNPQAMRLLGFRTNPKIRVSEVRLTPSIVTPGEAITFSFELEAQRNEMLLIDYIIDFRKANDRTSEKVFKIKSLEIAPGQKLTIKKRHPFRANATTFTLYPGRHHLTLQINGRRYSTVSFDIKT